MFLFYITKWSRGIGADRHIVLQWTGNSWRKAGEKWVKRTAESWGKLKGRTNQAQATAYTETGFMSEHGVRFTDMDHTLPMKVEFSVVPHNPVGKYSKKADGKIVFKEDKKYSINPSVKSLEELIGRQIAKQLNIANSIAKQPLQMLLIVAALGFAAGYIMYPYLPHPA